MFEVGFLELALCGVVALLVFGPERLPRVAREGALWLRKIKAAVHSAQQEIQNELEIQDLKQSLEEQKRQLRSTLSERIELLDHDKPKAKANEDKVDAGD